MIDCSKIEPRNGKFYRLDPTSTFGKLTFEYHERCSIKWKEKLDDGFDESDPADIDDTENVKLNNNWEQWMKNDQQTFNNGKDELLVPINFTDASSNKEFTNENDQSETKYFASEEEKILDLEAGSTPINSTLSCTKNGLSKVAIDPESDDSKDFAETKGRIRHDKNPVVSMKEINNQKELLTNDTVTENFVRNTHGRRYSKAFKLEVSAYLKTHTTRETSIKFDVPHGTVSKWRSLNVNDPSSSSYHDARALGDTIPLNIEDEEVSSHSSQIKNVLIGSSSKDLEHHEVPKHQFSLSFKNRVLEDLENETFKDTSLKHGILVSTLQSWKRSRDEATLIAFEIVNVVVDSISIESNDVHNTSGRRNRKRRHSTSSCSSLHSLIETKSKKYSEEVKKEIVKFSSTHSDEDTISMYEISKSSLKRWKKLYA